MYVVQQPKAGIAIYLQEKVQMKNLMMLALKIQDRLSNEEGQDLIEYALVVALIAFAAIVGMDTLATKINNAFGQIGNTLTSSMA
jgi:pilus assembly protein Flp/PilA